MDELLSNDLMEDVELFGRESGFEGDLSKTMYLNLCELYDIQLKAQCFSNRNEFVLISVHSCVISARSNEFKRILKHHHNRIVKRHHFHMKSELLTIEVPNYIPGEVLSELVRYLYTSEIDLHDEWIFDWYKIAKNLELKPLLHFIIERMLEIGLNSDIWSLYNRSYTLKLLELEILLWNCILNHTDSCIKQHAFLHISSEVILKLLREDTLSVNESTLWSMIVSWISVQLGLNSCENALSVDDFDEEFSSEMCFKLSSALLPLLQPGLIRIWNFSDSFFASKVESICENIPIHEKLLKYRINVQPEILRQSLIAQKPQFNTVSKLHNTLIQKHILPKYEIESRIRKTVLVYESTHPHIRGSTANSTKTCIKFPVWCNKIHVQFDPRCELAKYGDLTFYKDASCTTKVYSLYQELNRNKRGNVSTDTWYSLLNTKNSTINAEDRTKIITELSQQHQLSSHSSSTQQNLQFTLDTSCASLWFTFYSPASFDPGWGYKFTCTPDF